MKIKKRLITLLVVISLAVGLVACRTIGTSPDSQIDGDSKSSGTLVIEGSTSVQKIFQELADSFMEKNSDVVVEYMGTGSSSGIKAAIADTADIGTASREVKDEEIKKGLKVYQVAEDAIAIIVHPSNNIVALSKEHVAKIYTKEITNWKEVGGNDAPIVVVARDAASGTREAFEAIFDVKEKVKADQEAAKNGEVKTVISQNSNSIGYISLAFSYESVKNIIIDGAEATVENVINGVYTVTRPFNAVTLGEPSQLEEAFINFIYSDEGSAIISKEAVPVSK